MIKIIRAQVEDITTFLAFYKKMLKAGLYTYSENDIPAIAKEWMPKKSVLKKEIKTDKHILYLVKDQEKVVGYLLTQCEIGGVAFAHWLGIDKKYQNQGLGSKLLDVWEKEVNEKGFHICYLWTYQKNLEFYKNRGYTLMGEFPNSWFGVNHYLFFKGLK